MTAVDLMINITINELVPMYALFFSLVRLYCSLSTAFRTARECWAWPSHRAGVCRGRERRDGGESLAGALRHPQDSSWKSQFPSAGKHRPELRLASASSLYGRFLLCGGFFGGGGDGGVYFSLGCRDIEGL